jgi:hypothetical protein
MPKLKQIAPTFIVSDVGETARWYEQNLGFTIYPFPKVEPWVFASLLRDGVEIMLTRIQDYKSLDFSAQRPEGLWDAYIRMEGVKEFYNELKAKLPIKTDLKKQSYGDWEFEIADPNGYVLVFSELTD